MGANGASKPRGRPLNNQKRDATMRYIAKKKLWHAVALQCDVSPVAVRQWKRVPHMRVLDVEIAIGRSRAKIRPDLYRRIPKQPNA